MDIIEYLHMTPIELLGYSKNNIMEVKEKTEGIPQTYIDKLDHDFLASIVSITATFSSRITYEL